MLALQVPGRLRSEAAGTQHLETLQQCRHATTLRFGRHWVLGASAPIKRRADFAPDKFAKFALEQVRGNPPRSGAVQGEEG
jgi:hypothetical protein